MPGLTEAVLSGWYQNDTGELFSGFQITSADVVVDVGCGKGGNAAFCARQNARLIVTDVNLENIIATKEKLKSEPGRAEYHVSDSSPLPIAGEVATRVICTEVLEHVDDPAGLMKELVRIGQPGAKYLLSVPDPVSEHMMERIAPPNYFQRPNHVRIFERHAFDELVINAGLQIEHRASYSFYWTMWWLLFSSRDDERQGSVTDLTDSWERLWKDVLAKPKGRIAKQMLDEALPKSQLIVARKA